jgi:hypothetical protein
MRCWVAGTHWADIMWQASTQAGSSFSAGWRGMHARTPQVRHVLLRPQPPPVPRLQGHIQAAGHVDAGQLGCARHL